MRLDEMLELEHRKRCSTCSAERIFTLLLFAPHESGLMELAREVRGHLGVNVRTCFVTEAVGVPDPDWSDDVVVDSNIEAHRIYGAVGEAVYLVRPDGYVAFRGDATGSDQLHEYLAKILLPLPLATHSAEVAIV
jgi:hypothetical protein